MLSNNFVWGDIKLYLLLGTNYNENSSVITGGNVGINNHEYKIITVIQTQFVLSCYKHSYSFNNNIINCNISYHRPTSELLIRMRGEFTFWQTQFITINLLQLQLCWFKEKELGSFIFL